MSLNQQINEFAEQIKCTRYKNKTCYYNGDTCYCRNIVNSINDIKKIENFENSIKDDFGNYLAIQDKEILILDKFKIGYKVTTFNNITEKEVTGTIIGKKGNILHLSVGDSDLFKKTKDCKSCTTNFV